MSKTKIYLSSTYLDLKEFRAKVIGFINTVARDEFECCEIMEYMHDKGDNRDFAQICMTEVEKCDVYILLIGDSAGSIPFGRTEGLTYTQLEYDTATKTKKKIFRLKKKNFDPNLCPNKEQYIKFLEQFQGRFNTEFENDYEFEKEILKILYLIKPTANKIITSEDSLVSKINRQDQYSRFVFGREELGKNQILYYYYLFNSYDFAHLFNFRIINDELKENQLERRNRFSIKVSEIKPSNQKYLFNNLAKTFFNQGTTSGINGFFELFNKSSKSKLLIPITIHHQLETTDEIYGMVNNFLLLFEANKSLLNDGKQAIIFLAIQTEDETNNIDGIQKMVQGLPITDDSNLGSLEMVSKSDVKDWLLENINSVDTEAENLLNTHFAAIADKNSMDTIYNLADEFIKHIKIPQNDN